MRPWSTTSSKQWGQMDLAEWEDLKLGAPELVDELAVRDNGSIVAEWGPLKSFIVVQLLSRLFATPWTAAHQVSLSITNSRSLLKLMSIEKVMPSNHLTSVSPSILPSIFPSIMVFSNESVLRIRWPKYWSFNFSISSSNECSGMISFQIDWFDLL